MHLLPDRQLEDSPIVANCRMNRERSLHGSNGYDHDLRFDPLTFLQEVIKTQGSANWLDLCCGTGTALAQAASLADQNQLPLQIIGVDLAGLFVTTNSSRLTLIEASLNTWMPPHKFDLITSVHGLHYIGDKLGLIAKAVDWLTAKGRFAANLDLQNFKLHDTSQSTRLITAELRRAGFEYSSRTKLLTCDGHRTFNPPLNYLGADDQAGPNYTGQPAVNSHYAPLIHEVPKE